MTPVAAEALEKDSRQQAKRATWQQECRLRVTSFKFGAVLNRKEWTVKGLQNLTPAKDLSRVAAVKLVFSFHPSKRMNKAYMPQSGISISKNCTKHSRVTLHLVYFRYVFSVTASRWNH